jgi:hypothetical protein
MIQLTRMALQKYFFRTEAGPLRVLDLKEIDHGNKYNIKIVIDTAQNTWDDVRVSE